MYKTFVYVIFVRSLLLVVIYKYNTVRRMWTRELHYGQMVLYGYNEVVIVLEVLKINEDKFNLISIF